MILRDAIKDEYINVFRMPYEPKMDGTTAMASIVAPRPMTRLAELTMFVGIKEKERSRKDWKQLSIVVILSVQLCCMRDRDELMHDSLRVLLPPSLHPHR